MSFLINAHFDTIHVWFGPTSMMCYICISVLTTYYSSFSCFIIEWHPLYTKHLVNFIMHDCYNMHFIAACMAVALAKILIHSEFCPHSLAVLNTSNNRSVLYKLTSAFYIKIDHAALSTHQLLVCKFLGRTLYTCIIPYAAKLSSRGGNFCSSCIYV